MYENLEQAICQSFLPCFARALGMSIALPFEISVLGLSQRFVLSAGFALLALNPSSAGAFSTSQFEALLNLAANFVVGIMLGLPLLLLLQGAKLVGEMLDIGRGQNIAHAYDPITHNSETFSDQLLHALFWAAIVWSGALQVMFAVYYQSLQVIGSTGQMRDFLSQSWEWCATLVTTWLNFGFKLVCPLLFGYLLVDLAAALINKMLPQVSLFSESFQIKSCFGLLFIWALWHQIDVHELLAALPEKALPPAHGT
ncbi:MAG: hypothetical protein DCC75_11030 [Proteobacteria bacterium]|nr:MAG: hypothetical protein DCC75_11030 [Pseudomonadota bacterium]